MRTKEITIRPIILIFIFLIFFATGSLAETRVIDLQSTYGISQSGIARAIDEAKKGFAVQPNDTVVLKFPAGTFDISRSQGKGIIDVSGVKPGPQGRLIFRGQGMDKTTLVMDQMVNWIYGVNVYRVTFAGMHMTGKNYTVSQGHVVKISPGKIVLDIQPGFPSPMDIFNKKSRHGRYLRKYTDSRTDPHLVEADNAQVPWVSTEHITGSRWQMNLKRRNFLAPYQKGDLIAIKSKLGGNTFWFNKGSDIAFEDIKWTQVTRGVFRGGIGKVRISRCVIERSPAINGQTPCLASAAGGPQIGNPNDPPTLDNLVENCRFTATGDDSVAFFNGTGIIRNTYVTDSFGRGILLYKSPDVVLENNNIVRSPILKESARGGV